ncbi:MAG TPA: hypothetical protein PLO99_03690 [Chitinophagaceae bacterium]|jgi:hypothetical protein|nr:hypothetical protein [Chitinophagaceae bacterium]HRG91348.1 hypothetical protein [Chitinophagaceae bacterium]
MKFPIFVLGFFLFASISSPAQTATIKAATVNNLLRLVKVQDSIPALKGEEKKGEDGGIYNVAKLPAMGKYPIHIEEYPQQPKPYSFSIPITLSKTLTYLKLKTELKTLIKSKAIKGVWKTDQDNEFSLYFIGTDSTGIHLIMDMSEKMAHINIYNIEGQLQ